MKIITFTCDAYRDIIPAYHYLWQKYWPDCPYEFVYVTNSKPLGIQDTTVHYLKGSDIKYAKRLRTFVKRHCRDDELGLFMMGDYLVKGLNIPLIEKARRLCERKDVAHCRLRPMPHPQLPPPVHLKLDKAEFGEINRRQRYSLSLQPGIWKPKVLASLLEDSWNPWLCETKGSGNTRRIQGHFLCTQKPAIIHHNYYRKRKVFGPGWVKKNVPKKYWTKAVRRAKG